VDVEGVLSGRAGHRGVRDALLGEGRAALLDALHEMLGPQRRPVSCDLLRAQLKPGRKLSGFYEAAVEGEAAPLPVAVAWYADGVPEGSCDELAAAEEELRRDGVETRLRRLWAVEPASAMLVRAAPLDPAFPHLGRLSDPRRVPEALAGWPGAPATPAAGWSVRPLRYRPGQRHVLEYGGGRTASLFVKLYEPGTGHAVAAAVVALADVLDAAGDPCLRAVRPAAVLCDGDALVYGRAPGSPLSLRLSAGRPAGRGHLERVARLLRALHATAPDAAPSLPRRELGAEIRTVLRACEAMSALRPDLGALAAAVVAHARRGLEALAGEPDTVVHGDMKADHMLLAGDELCALDTDRCSLGDPAFDLGKMLADLRWWSRAGAGAAARAAEAELLAAYGAAGPRLGDRKSVV